MYSEKFAFYLQQMFNMNVKLIICGYIIVIIIFHMLLTQYCEQHFFYRSVYITFKNNY